MRTFGPLSFNYPPVRKDEPASAGAAILGDLPEWNLADLYSSPECPELKSDLAAAESLIAAFETHRGRVTALDGGAFGAAIAAYEAISEVLGKIGSYAQLFHAGDVSDAKRGKFYQDTSDKLTELGGRTLFFTLEINRLDDTTLAEKMKHPAAARYAPWVRDLRVFRAHELSDDLEKLFLDKTTTSRAAWVRLYDETLAGIRCKVGDQDLTLTHALHQLSDTSGEKRRLAAKAVGAALNEKQSLFTLITNTLAKDKAIEDDWRKYQAPVSSRNLGNLVEDEVVQALVSATKSAYSETAHRYYKLKARWFGLDQLQYWDRNAPLPKTEDRKIAWPEAKSIVLDAYRGFAPALADVAESFFTNRWIDAPARAGKASGAFAHPVVPSAHPYILLNYMGSARDVMTLAHELGHGVHQVLAGAQGGLMANTPLTLAETASIFGEMLTFQALLAAETRPVERRALLASKVEDMLNTVIRQIAFHEFERHVHDERKSGELSAERLAEIWLTVQRESLGPAFNFDDEYKVYWSYVSHFLHAPFYVYAYAFGDCLVNSLYDVYTSQSVTGFQDKYLSMLAAGGRHRHKELLAPFGLDASDPGFWKRGMSTISTFIDQLEKVS